jgi:hypothetical protein
MIADLDETIRRLLKEELPIRNSEIEVSFEQPSREWSAKLSRPTINLFLHDVRENNVLRRHQWEPAGNGSPGDNRSHRKRSPMRVDCQYMLTTWANDPADEHRLLTRCLLVLFRFPVLPEDRLVGSLQHPPYDIQARLAHHDQLTNPAEVWSALDNELRPSIPYVITLALDPWTEVRDDAIVRTLTLHTGQSQNLPRYPRLSKETRQELTLIGGTVWDRAEKGVPRSGIEVAVKGTGLFDTTDDQGRFTLGSLPRGQYTLVAWAPEGKPSEKRIAVPVTGPDGALAADGDYDLEI